LEKLLDLVEKSCHQIHKETMVHKAALKVWKGWCHWMHEGLSLSLSLPLSTPELIQRGKKIIFRWQYLCFNCVCRRKWSKNSFKSLLSGFGWTFIISWRYFFCWLGCDAA
jgi:hypothetical protein